MCAKETERILKENKSGLLTMADVLIEKETIYAEEVDMIISGMSKEEVIAHIDAKDKKEEVKPEEKKDETSTDSLLNTISKVENLDENKSQENQEKIAENNQKNENIIDKLLEEAEKREKELLKKAKNEAQNKDVEAGEEKAQEKKKTASSKPKTTASSAKKSTTTVDADKKQTTRKTTTKKVAEKPADKKLNIDKSAESDKIDVTDNKD